MSEVLENILGQLSKWGEVVVDKSGFYFKKAVDQGGKLTKLTKIQLDIEKMKRELKSNFTELGEVIFTDNLENNTFDFTDNTDVKTLFEKITDIKNEIVNLTKEKADVKAHEAANNSNDVPTEEKPKEDEPDESKCKECETVENSPEPEKKEAETTTDNQ